MSMKKRKVAELSIDEKSKAEFYLTDITLSYINKEPRSIPYNDILFIQEMFLERDKEKKNIVGLYLRSTSSTKDPTITLGDFSDKDQFLEAFYSVKNAIPNFENQLIGFVGNVLLPKQKPKRCELGLDHRHVLIRVMEDSPNYFFRIEVNNCKVENIANQNILKLYLHQSQLEMIYFANQDDVFTFKNNMYQAIEESQKENTAIYDDIEDIDKFKIYLLENSNYLKTLHERLVMSGAMKEEEFWESRAEFQEYQKYELENKQKFSKNSGLLIKDKQASAQQKQRILTQYPEVESLYKLEVKDDDPNAFEKDRKFWDDFFLLQKNKDTEIVGGRNPIALPQSKNSIYQFGDQSSRKVNISEIPLGDVDLCRNLDMKTNVAEKLMHDTLKDHYYEPGKVDVESTIKKFQVHGLNVLGGIKPVVNIQTSNIQEIIDEFKDLIPEHLEIPEEMQVKTVKTQIGEGTGHKGSADDKMMIEMISTQRPLQGLDGKASAMNADAISAKLQRLTGNPNEITERRKQVFSKNDMQNVFRELVQASLQKEESLDQNREMYENYQEQAQDLLRLFYSAGLGEPNANENKRKTMKNLINELIGKINLSLDKETKRQETLNTPDKAKEINKLSKVMETVLEQLKFAVNVKE